MMNLIKALIFVFPLFFANTNLKAIEVVAQTSEQPSVEEIIVVFKMHFDIGYTDWCESVLQKYTTSMIDETLHSVDMTSSLPKEEQFVWTLPGWPMQYILDHVTPDRKEKVEKSLKDGRLSVHALPFTFETEASDLETLVRSMSFSSNINKKYGQPLPRAAKLTDVPSHSWVLPTLLTHAGVKFLHIGCNPGSKSPDLPTLFWWEGPDGSRLLTLNWAQYYGSGVVPPKEWNHKTWLAMIHTNDNTGAPTPEEVASVLKEAHEKVPHARVRIGRLEDFYDALIKENPDLPIVRGDMPDTWIHGYMSTPRAVKINKSVQRKIFNEEALNTQLKIWGCPSESISLYVEQAMEQSLLADEHTFGVALIQGNQREWRFDEKQFAVDRAKGEYDFIEESWYEKEHRAHRANQLITPSLRKDLRHLAREVGMEGKKIVVYNPLPWQRSGIVTLHMGILPKKFEVKALRNEMTGKVIPAYNDGNMLSFCADAVPSMGYSTFRILTEEAAVTASKCTVDQSAGIIENEFFKITISPVNGSLSSVWDKRQKKEMVDVRNEYGFGEFVYEKFGNEELDRYAKSYVKPGAGWVEFGRPHDPVLTYDQIKGKVKDILYRQLPHAVEATAFCSTEANEDYTLTYTLYNHTPYIEICWGMENKRTSPHPVGGWLAFPFKVDTPTFHLGRIGAVVNPATDFVKDTNHDYCFLNTGMALTDQQGNGYGLNTPNAPGVSLDRMGLCRFTGDFIPKQPNVFVNLFNTHWGTNFTEWLEGSFSAKVYIWSIDHYQNEPSLITPTEETRVSLMAAYADGKGGNLPVCQSGLELSEKGILVTAFGENPDGKGEYLLRLWEQAGRNSKCEVTLPATGFQTAYLCNLRGERVGSAIAIKQNKLEVDLKAYSPLTLQLIKK